MKIYKTSEYTDVVDARRVSHASRRSPDVILRRSFTRPSTALAVIEGLGTRLTPCRPYSDLQTMWSQNEVRAQLIQWFRYLISMEYSGSQGMYSIIKQSTFLLLMKVRGRRPPTQQWAKKDLDYCSKMNRIAHGIANLWTGDTPSRIVLYLPDLLSAGLRTEILVQPPESLVEGQSSKVKHYR